MTNARNLPEGHPRILLKTVGIKHDDGFRIPVLRDAADVRLYTRNGNDFSFR